MSEGSEISDRLAALEALLAEQAARIAALQRALAPEAAPTTPRPQEVQPAPPPAVGRRQLLGGFGKVAAGAVAGGAAMVVASASPAAAATTVGDATGTTPGITGNTAVSTAPGVKATSNQAGSAAPALRAENTAANATAVSASSSGAGGFAVVGNAVNNGTGVLAFGLIGVKGETNLVNGIGVDGSSIGTGGIGVRGTGSTDGVKGVSTATFGVGVHGTATGVSVVGVLGEGSGLNNIGVKGEGVTGVRGNSTGGDGNGVLGLSSANGFAGVRGQSSGGGVPNGLTSGVLGTTNGGDSFGVSGQGAGGGGTGVYGVGTTFGVRARAVANAPLVPPPSAQAAGLVAEGVGVLGGVPAAGLRATSSAGVGGQVSGAAANLHLVAGAAGPARDHTFGHAVGELALESNGTVWVCVAASGSGQPGAWKRLAFVEDLPPGFDPGTLTGAFVAPPKPGRVYDSRNGDGKLAGGQARTISVATTLPTPSDPSVEIVPVGSSAAVFTLTLDQTEGSGFLSVFPSNVAFPGTSSINWFANGQIVANGGTVTLPADRTVTVLAGGAGSTHFLLDITGVYT